MKRINNILIYVVSIISLCFAVKDINLLKYDRLIGDLSIFFVFMIPRLINKIFKLKISDKLYFVYIIFIIIAQFFGTIIDLYNKTSWYDLFAHFISGILTGVLAIIILNLFNMNNKENKLFNILFILSFAVFIATIWEFGEFSMDKLLGLNLQRANQTGVSDTMEDMLISFLGTIIITIYYNIKERIL